VLGLLLGIAGHALAALKLTWQDNSQVEERYWVLRQAHNQKSFQIVADLGPDAVQWLDQTTRKNRSYCYMVVAVKKDERGFSNVACAREGRPSGGNMRIGFSIGGGGGRGQLTLIVDQQ
jgi:hypothetical protein